jgi:hypothetical protein
MKTLLFPLAWREPIDGIMVGKGSLQSDAATMQHPAVPPAAPL